MAHQAVIFQRNLRYLLGKTGLNMRQIAERCDLGPSGYKWLRRVSAEGIERTQTNNVDRLNEPWRFLEDNLKLDGETRKLLKSASDVLWLENLEVVMTASTI